MFEEVRPDELKKMSLDEVEKMSLDGANFFFFFKVLWAGKFFKFPAKIVRDAWFVRGG
jgi:hypothetical protein